MSERKKNLAAALKGLGANKKIIAKTLAAKKIKGIPCDVNNCPIATYIKKLFPKTTVEVYDSVIIFFKDKEKVRVKLSVAIDAFMEDFDDGKYPELVKPSWKKEHYLEVYEE